MKVQLAPQVIKKIKNKNVRIRKSFRDRIQLFRQNPTSSQLHNHALKKEYKGLRSIDITADYRAIYEEIDEGEEKIAYFSLFGTHQELYKKRRNKLSVPGERLELSWPL